MYRIVVTDHFDAAHYLPGIEVCCNLHGHTWKVEACVCSPKLNSHLMVADFRLIKSAWKKYDHTLLNDAIPMPTAEVLCERIWDNIMQVIEVSNPKSFIESVRVWESENSYAECCGDL